MVGFHLRCASIVYHPTSMLQDSLRRHIQPLCSLRLHEISWRSRWTHTSALTFWSLLIALLPSLPTGEAPGTTSRRWGSDDSRAFGHWLCEVGGGHSRSGTKSRKEEMRSNVQETGHCIKAYLSPVTTQGSPYQQAREVAKIVLEDLVCQCVSPGAGLAARACRSESSSAGGSGLASRDQRTTSTGSALKKYSLACQPLHGPQNAAGEARPLSNSCSLLYLHGPETCLVIKASCQRKDDAVY